MNIIRRRRLWYGISASILIPAALALVMFGLKLGIDFTGGSVVEVSGNINQSQIRDLATQNQLEDVSLVPGANGHQLVRYRVDENLRGQEQTFQADLASAGYRVERFDQVGPSVSQDLATNALLSLGAMSLAIVAYITWSFRHTPKGVSSLSFGVATITAAFLHDAIFVLGVFAILGKLLQVEVDTYIITAILTVIGFSIHDTVVVFDRIREKLGAKAENFANTINLSVNETMVRSINTSMVIVLVLLALFLFGGSSTRYFILALLLGMVSGTYSSIFIASPLLVDWHNKITLRRTKQR
jgi:preprotein translocase subunit SecF